MSLSEIRWRQRLGIKLIVLVAAVTSAAFAALVVLGLRADERYLVAEVVRGAAQFSDAIRSSTHSHMLRDDRADAYRVLRLIGNQSGVERVRVFNKDGRVTFSTQRREIGTHADKSAEYCRGCHATGTPAVLMTTADRVRVYDAPDHRVLGMVTPIYNEHECSSAACHAHSPQQRVLGLVDLGLSLATIDAELASLRRDKLVTAGLVVLTLAVVVALFFRRHVVRPVGDLVRATERVAHGDLEQPIAVARTDELGLLARSFNEMMRSLGAARGELRSLMQTLEHQVAERTAELREAQGRLVQSEKLSSLGKLSASIAHEINNPLAGILTTSKLLLRTLEEGPLDEKATAACMRHLKLVQRETERCTTIVRNLLEFARQRPLALKEIQAAAPLDEALSLVANQLSISGIRVERDLAPVPAVHADFGQLRQAYLNIVLNAAEAMNKGGLLRVLVREGPGRTVEVEIADTGPGIPPDLLGKVLDPFFTTKEKGTGLGLSVVYGIVERHGGKLELRSEVGQGTSVVVRLPQAAGPAVQGPAVQGPAVQAGAA